MRTPHPRLKLRRRTAETPYMHRGGWSFRRRLAALTLVTGVSLALMPGAGAQARARSDAAAAGEAGSGPPMPPPPVLSKSALRAATTIKFSDVPADLADQSSTAISYFMPSIRYVAGTNNWMRDYKVAGDGTYPFKPNAIESRRQFARATVRAFAPTQAIDKTITFSDMGADDPFYPYANVAVQNGWIRPSAAGAFRPLDPVLMRTVHRVLVIAVGLGDTAKDLDAIHTANGFSFDTPRGFGTTLLGMRLGLRYNHSSPYEGVDVLPGSPMPRSEVAYSLYQATHLDSWAVSNLQTEYNGITLGTLGKDKRAVVQWGIDYTGYPYWWGGEWGDKTPAGYPFGAQSHGGFDCSGVTWWTMKASGSGWDNAPPRPYAGWNLPQRTSAEMATVGKVGWNHLAFGDLMFYDGNGDKIVDHVDTYIGNGFSIDSSGTPGGVTLMWVGDGWYKDHFVHGRHMLPTT